MPGMDLNKLQAEEFLISFNPPISFNLHIKSFRVGEDVERAFNANYLIDVFCNYNHISYQKFV